MKIAVTSQNRKHITEHAGRCRKFWIFSIEDKEVIEKRLLELPKEQSFHDSPPHEEHPLDDVDVLISRGMGQGLVRRLKRKNIDCQITSETDPETAVSLFVRGKLTGKHPRRHSRGRDEE